MKRVLTKKNGKWVVFEVEKKPYVCPDWMKDNTPFDWKEEETKNQKFK